MDNMMGGGTGAWILLWIFLGLAVIAGGVLAARTLATRRKQGRARRLTAGRFWLCRHACAQRSYRPAVEIPASGLCGR
jgi:hypothetical protein